MKNIRKGFVLISLILIGTGIVSVFWKQELVYALPTPVPADHVAVRPGTKVNLNFDAKNIRGRYFYIFLIRPVLARDLI